MTKEDLQKELLEKVKPGTKPSQLKKLKRSKSDSDIPPAPPFEQSETSTELDQSLMARHKSLKDWFIQYSKNKNLEQELKENIEQASEELISQDKKISSLHSQNIKLKQTNQSLEKDLELVHRAVKWRSTPYSAPEASSDYLKYILYSLLGMWFVLLLYKVRESPNE